MAKEFSRGFYDSVAWKKCRDEYRKSVHYLCENCLSKGIYKAGVIVHHKIELTPFNINDPSITLDFNNLELLCRECHAEEHDIVGGKWATVNKKRKEQKNKKKRYIVGNDGEIILR